MFNADVYKIMFGTPSDIVEEINIFNETIQKWNYLNAEKESIILLPLHWSTSAYPSKEASPQKIINDQVVAKSDMFICVFGTRLGTATDSFESGTIEEIEEHHKAGKPVMIFFRNSNSDTRKIDIEQFSKLKKFKKCIQGKALYWDYSDENEFKVILYEKLSLHANDHFRKEKAIANNLADSVLSRQSLLSDFDIERLKQWAKTDDSQFYSIFFEGGGCIYGLGAINQYEIKNGKEKVEWDDFFERLLKLKFIEIEKYNKDGHPIYQLKKAAYDFVEAL